MAVGVSTGTAREPDRNAVGTYRERQSGNLVPRVRARLCRDGHAILLGEVVGRDGTRRDIQLKGSGRTPFSRDGDGRAALGPVLREYIVSEAMAALGVPTTRALDRRRAGLARDDAARRRAGARRRSGQAPGFRSL